MPHKIHHGVDLDQAHLEWHSKPGSHTRPLEIGESVACEIYLIEQTAPQGIWLPLSRFGRKVRVGVIAIVES
jgi:hypothetical protein